MSDEETPTDEEAPPDEEATPDEAIATDAFEPLGHPARTSILRALLDARRSGEDPSLGFTELRDRSAVDDTGRFNYHLDQLLDAYVTTTDEGYRLSSFGFRVLAPMVAGRYDPDLSPDPIDAPGECYECGESLRIRYREDVWQVVCAEGHTVNYGLIGYPGIVADRTPEEAVEAFAVLNAQALELGVTGTCPTCHGRLEGRIVAAESVGGRPATSDAYVYRAPCDSCGNQFTTSVGGCVVAHPEVVRFLADRGVDVRRTAPWDLAFRRPGAETVLSEEPLRLRVAVGEEVGDGETGSDGEADLLSAIVDEQGSVVSVERGSE